MAESLIPRLGRQPSKQRNLNDKRKYQRKLMTAVVRVFLRGSFKAPSKRNEGSAVLLGDAAS